jgi:hypothetical protein
MKRITLWLMVSLVALFLASCAAEPQTVEIEVTRVVTETVIEEVEVAVTREVSATDGSEGGSPHTPTDGPKVSSGAGWVDESGTGGSGDGVRGEGGMDDGLAMPMEAEPAMAEAEAMMPAGTAPPAPSRGEGGTAVEFAAEPMNQDMSLTAGNVDDNADWDAYLTYLRQYSGTPIIPVDVSERHQIWVQDPTGFPVLGAKVQVFADGQVVQTLRTMSDGRVYFFPRALPVNQQAAEYRLTAEFGGQTSELVLTSGGANNLWTIEHPVGNDPQAAVTRLDVLFLIDTTGSMADEIFQLTANVQSIARRINSLPQAVDVRYGMTVYRDRGDEYTTRTFEFTPDINFFEEGLRQVSANGGGDYPEDLNEGLFKAIHVPEWRVEETVSLIFLIADAPPQLGYSDQETNYALEMVNAAERGIKLYAIASSGTDDQAEYVFRQLAQYTGGKFLFLTYGAGGAGTTGTETTMTVEEGSYDVTSLDGLVMQMIEEELAHRVR